MRKSKWKIRTRLSVSFAIMLFVPIAIEGLGVARLSDLNGNIEQLADHRVPALTAAYASVRNLQDAAVRMGNILISDDPTDIKAQFAAINDDRQKAQEAMQTLSAATTSPEGKATLQEVLTLRAAYVPNEAQFLELAEAGNKAAAKKMLLESVRPSQVAIVDALDRFIELEKTGVAAITASSAQQYHASRSTVIVCAVLLYVIGSAIAKSIIDGLRRELGGESDYAAEIASHIASGNLDMEIRTRAGDQSSLLFTMRSMRDNLLQIVSHVGFAADLVRQGTAELSQGNGELSRRTQEQATALTRTSANMEELTVSVKQNADNARQTTRRAMEVCGQAESGGAVVQRAVGAMAEISASSRKIADIIGVIDEIAFQTNLLALNAAVEAARAGEQGRGFAVVASEVRSLAQRSATAAKQIKELITESVAKVDVGSELIDESGKTLTQIIVSVKKVADVIAEIATASEEQASGIEEVNVAVARMDSTTQQNSGLVDHAAATSRDIQRQAEDLAAKVTFFQTGAALTRRRDDTPRVVASPASSAPSAFDLQPRTMAG